MFQYRRTTPRGHVRDPYYSPERDLAYIGPPMIHRSLEFLEKTPETFRALKDFIDTEGLSEEEIVEGVKAYAKLCAEVIDQKDPATAMAETGFDQVPPKVQMVLLACLGFMALGAIWSGVKDVNVPGAEPPAEMSELLEQAVISLRERSDADQQ